MGRLVTASERLFRRWLEGTAPAGANEEPGAAARGCSEGAAIHNGSVL